MSSNGRMATSFYQILLCYTDRPTLVTYNIYCLVSNFMNDVKD